LRTIFVMQRLVVGTHAPRALEGGYLGHFLVSVCCVFGGWRRDVAQRV
jgi:hypothetical protein